MQGLVCWQLMSFAVLVDEPHVLDVHPAKTCAAIGPCIGEVHGHRGGKLAMSRQHHATSDGVGMLETAGSRACDAGQSEHPAKAHGGSGTTHGFRGVRLCCAADLIALSQAPDYPLESIRR